MRQEVVLLTSVFLLLVAADQSRPFGIQKQVEELSRADGEHVDLTFLASLQQEDTKTTKGELADPQQQQELYLQQQERYPHQQRRQWSRMARGEVAVSACVEVLAIEGLQPELEDECAELAQTHESRLDAVVEWERCKQKKACLDHARLILAADSAFRMRTERLSAFQRTVPTHIAVEQVASVAATSTATLHTVFHTLHSTGSSGGTPIPSSSSSPSFQTHMESCVSTPSDARCHQLPPPLLTPYPRQQQWQADADLPAPFAAVIWEKRYPKLFGVSASRLALPADITSDGKCAYVEFARDSVACVASVPTLGLRLCSALETFLTRSPSPS